MVSLLPEDLAEGPAYPCNVPQMPPIQRLKLMVEGLGVQIATMQQLLVELEHTPPAVAYAPPPPPTPTEYPPDTTDAGASLLPGPDAATEPQRKFINVLLAKARKANITVETPFGTPFEWVMSKGEASQIINHIKAALGEE